MFWAQDAYSRDRGISLPRHRQDRDVIFLSRLRRDVGASRGHLITETSRPRPHACLLKISVDS